MQEEMDVKECLVVCGDKNLGVGLTIWDLQTGDRLLHIPTCASPPFGLTCLRNQYLVASQIHRPGSVGGGVIFTWPLCKTQATLRNYPLEIIGPLCCTKDGTYLAGGSPSGNISIWEVTNGRLLKSWHAHQSPLTCLVFSNDGSLLTSGSEDGMVVVWSMISLLDKIDSGSCSSVLCFLTAHTSFVTGLLSTASISNSFFVSSSLDGTCKVWDVISGTLLQTRSFPGPVMAIVLDPAEQFLFSGTADGRIFVTTFEAGVLEDPYVNPEDQQIVLNGHKESITALAFCKLGLISASEDCTACLWDATSWVIIRSFQHQKGYISNLLVIPESSLLPMKNHQRETNSFRVSLLDKYPQTPSSCKGNVTLAPSQVEETKGEYCSTNLLNQQIIDFEGEKAPDAIQMKVDTCIENRLWATKMTKHVMEMNKHLQSKLLDIAEYRLIGDENKSSAKERGGKKKKNSR